MNTPGVNKKNHVTTIANVDSTFWFVYLDSGRVFIDYFTILESSLKRHSAPKNALICLSIGVLVTIHMCTVSENTSTTIFSWDANGRSQPINVLDCDK